MIHGQTSSLKLLIFLGGLLINVSLLPAQGPIAEAIPIRQIYVPFDSLEVLLEGNSNRVLLTRDEYDQLLESARIREIKRAPVDSAILSAQYTAQVDQGVATITGTLMVESLNSGSTDPRSVDKRLIAGQLVEVPLSLNGVAIRSAKLQKIGESAEQPANLWRNPNGELVLLVTGNSKHQLTIEMTTPLQTTAARQTMSIQLPTPSATNFQLRVPGNVEVKSGAAVIDRKYNGEKNVTTFELLPAREAMNIVMSLNNRLVKDEQVVVSRSVLIHKLTRDQQEIHLTCSLDVIQGALEEIEFQVPAGFDVRQVNTALLHQWEIEQSPAEDLPADDRGRTRLLVKLRQPTREPIVLNITAINNSGPIGNWQADTIRPIDVAGQVSIVGVITETELKTPQFSAENVIPIDHQFLLAALPSSVQNEPVIRPVRVAAAFYAPQAKFSIAADFTIAQPELLVKSNSRLMIGKEHLELQSGLSLVSRYDSRFSFSLSLPKLWRLTELTDSDNQPLRFVRLESNDAAKFLVYLPKRISGNSATAIFFQANHTPENWLEEWETNEIEFPVVTIEDQTEHTGTIAVSTNEDLLLKPQRTVNLELLNETDKKRSELERENTPLAYSFDNVSPELKIEIQRLEPIIIARTYNFFTILPDQLQVHVELVLDVKQAGEDLFEFELPLDSPKSIAISANDAQLKDYHSIDTQTARIWTVQLARPQTGTVHLIVDYSVSHSDSLPGDSVTDTSESSASEFDAENRIDRDAPESGRSTQLSLNPIVVNNVRFQSSMLAIEGSSELDIEIDTDARSVDVGELAAAIYQPGRRLLGTYSWPNEKLSLSVNLKRRPVYVLPAAIVQSAEMVTSVSNRGTAQTAARFKMATKQQPFLRIELPRDSTLWSVLLDGQPAKPQRLSQGNGSALLISLLDNEISADSNSGLNQTNNTTTDNGSASSDSIYKLRELQLVYETKSNSFNFFGTVQANSPTLWLSTSEEANSMPVPLVDLRWHLVMPTGFTVSHTDGNFQSSELVRRPSPIRQLGNWIYWLGGGIGGYDGLQARETARRPSPMAASQVAENDWFDESTENEFVGNKNTQSLDFGLTNTDKIEPLMSQLSEGEQLELNTRGLERKPVRDSSKLTELASGSRSGKRSLDWAFSGLRSLNIELTDTGNSIEFYNLGEVPTLNATVVNQTRLNWVALTVAFLITAISIFLTHKNLKFKLFFIIGVLLFTCLVALAGAAADSIRTVIDMLLLAAVMATLYFVVAWLVKVVYRSISSIAVRRPMLLVLWALSFSFAPPSEAQENVSNVDQLRRMLIELQTDTKVALPDNAIIIPFDINDPRGRERADRLLIPYEDYLKLINQAQPDDGKKTQALTRYVISSAQYDLQLSLEDDVSFHGKLVIEVLSDEPISVALPFMGGALAKATVDGKPAMLQLITVDVEDQKQTRQQSTRQSKTAAEVSNSLIQLHLDGRGTKTFEFTVQVQPERQGGWRFIDARLPVGVTRGLDLLTDPVLTEVRINSDSDQRSIDAQPQQKIATVLGTDGSIQLQWKPATEKQTIDQSLTANSEAVFDVREDGLRLIWQLHLDFRGSERDFFTLNLPTGFLVERVTGENIRSWDIKKNENDNQQEKLTVALLGAAKDTESFLVELSRRDFGIGNDESEFDAPYLNVEGAALHQGTYLIRRSPIIDLKTTELMIANRIDESSFENRIDIAKIDANSSPLGIETFQLVQFISMPFKIGLKATLVPRVLSANVQTILRIGQSEANLESKIHVAVDARPIYSLGLELPQGIEILSISAGRNETWTSEPSENNNHIQLFFPAGVTRELSLLMEANLTEYAGENELTVPTIKVKDAEEQTGEIVVQVDPALSVTTGNLENCETILLKQVENWLKPDQRAVTRLALKTKGKDYSATLQFKKIEPRVSVETITNVRTTLVAIEETILLDFDIQQAGIRQIQFEIPSAMKDARIVAKMVRETTIQPVPNNPEIVNVTLDLQDDVVDSYRIVVENDRQLSATQQSVPVPHVLTGTTEGRFVALQNSGRDEIRVLDSNDFMPMNRQLNQFNKLQQKLAGGELTMAYVANSESDWPVLQFETQQREIFDTAAASIEFSKTTMVVDSSGGYRALQNFQINNRSEQYLEVELPDGSQLLTVVVDGQPVKPVAWPAAGTDRKLRIPLVKTQLGDLDYPVQLKYAGRLNELSNFTNLQFPVINTLNINVQLSQLHLRLPESHRWIDFAGTMTKVDSGGELEEGYLSYKSRQIQQLAEQIKAESAKFGSSEYSSYSKSRAFKNLKKLEKDLNDYERASVGEQALESNGQLSALIRGNQDAIQQAQDGFDDPSKSDANLAIDNRKNFNELVLNQSGRFSRNSVTKGGQNFYQQDIDAAGSQEPNDRADRKSGVSLALPESPFGGDSGLAIGKGGRVSRNDQSLDAKWLARNRLENDNPPQKEASMKKSEANQFSSPQSQPDFAADGGIPDFKAPGYPNQEIKNQGIDAIVDSPYQAAQLGEEKADSDDLFAETIVQEALKDNAGRVVELEVSRNAGPLRGSLTSLDIKLPSRGSDFYFKSPRGNATVTARPIADDTVSRWASVVSILGICFGVWLVWRLSGHVRDHGNSKVFIVVGLLVIGIMSVATAFLPIFGLLAIATAVVLIFGWVNGALVSQPS